MKKTLFAAGMSALALLAAGVALAQSGEGRLGRDADVTRAQLVAELDARFAKLDANGDGNISAAEQKAAREARFAERFKRMDLDGNGSITLAEMQAAHERRGDRGEAGAEHRGRHGGRRHFGGWGGWGGGRGNADANGDGLTSKAEFQTMALQHFDRSDADRNGVLTAAERQQARAAMKAERAR